MKHEIKVGQTVYVVSKNRNGVELVPTETKVTKVSRIYFEIDYVRGDSKFMLNSLESASAFGYKSRVYLSRQDFSDEKETARLFSKLRKSMDSQFTSPFSLEQLRKVYEILELTEKTNTNEIE